MASTSGDGAAEEDAAPGLDAAYCARDDADFRWELTGPFSCCGDVGCSWTFDRLADANTANRQRSRARERLRLRRSRALLEEDGASGANRTASGANRTFAAGLEALGAAPAAAAGNLAESALDAAAFGAAVAAIDAEGVPAFGEAGCAPREMEVEGSADSSGRRRGLGATRTGSRGTRRSNGRALAHRTTGSAGAKKKKILQAPGMFSTVINALLDADNNHE